MFNGARGVGGKEKVVSGSFATSQPAPTPGFGGAPEFSCHRPCDRSVVTFLRIPHHLPASYYHSSLATSLPFLGDLRASQGHLWPMVGTGPI